MKKSAVMTAMIATAALLLTITFMASVQAYNGGGCYYDYNTLTASISGVVLATFDYSMYGCPNEYVWLVGALNVHQPWWLVALTPFIRIDEQYGWWWIRWWDYSDDWSPNAATMFFDHPSGGSHYVSIYSWDQKTSNRIHYKVSAKLLVDYYKVWGVYGYFTCFRDYYWDL